MSENKKQEKQARDSKKNKSDAAALNAAKIGIREYRNTLRRLAK